MRSGAAGVVALLAFAALAFPDRARACDPVGSKPHTIDPAQVGVDQTPPALAQPVVARLGRIEHVDDGGCQAKCGWDYIAVLTNLATDDMTPADGIGYRLTTVAGTEPSVKVWPQDAIVGAGDGTLTLFWDGDDDFDFTLQVIAIDAAGNESAPRTVRIHDDAGGCSVGRRRAGGGLVLLVVAMALASAMARCAPSAARASRCRR